MKNIHTPEVLNELITRINTLTPNSQRQWGKMDVAQMMAHCSAAIEANLGEGAGKQGLLGRIFGKMAKKSVVSEEPFKQGLPTDKSFVIIGAKEFQEEKQRLTTMLSRLSATAPANLAKNPHPFFGKMTESEWNSLNYKHMDHHLRQFGA